MGEKINSLPQKLGLPERFGKVILAPLVHFPLPETARIYDFPAPSGESEA